MDETEFIETYAPCTEKFREWFVRDMKLLIESKLKEANPVGKSMCICSDSKSVLIFKTGEHICTHCGNEKSIKQ